MFEIPSFCRHCGTRSTPGSRICLDCGATCEPEAPPASPAGPAPPPRPGGLLDSFPTPPGWKGPAWTFVAAYAGAVVLIVGVLGFLWLRSRLGVPDLEDLARLAPGDTRLFAAVSVDVGVGDLKRLREWKTALEGTEAGREALRGLESTLGSSLEDLAGWVLPAGFAALQPLRSGEPPSSLWVLRVRSEAGAREAVERFVGAPGLTATRVGGFDGWTAGGHTIVVGRGYLVVGSSPGEVEAVLDRAGSSSQPGLASRAEFQKALAHLGDDPEMLAWADLPGLREDAAPLLGMAPGSAVQALGDLRSASFASSRRSGEWTSKGFLGLSSPPASGLVRALLRKPVRATVDPASLVPAGSSVFVSQDLSWTMGLVRELVTLSGQPDPFPELARETGLDVNAFLADVEGPVGLALDSRDLLAEGRGSEPSALVVMGSRNPEALERGLGGMARGLSTAGAEQHFVACQSNERNIATALEMWSTDNSGRYPASMALLEPNYLRAIPTCPSAGRDTYSASYTSRAMPDDFAFHCTGSHVELGVPFGYPRYDGMIGLTPGPRSGAPVATTLPRQTAKHDGRTLQGFTSGSSPVWWATSDKPSALLLGIGPRAKEMVQDGLDTVSSGRSLAQDSGYRALSTASEGPVVSTVYFDLEPFLDALAARDPELRKSLETARGMLGDSTGLVLRVKDDGLELDMKGAGPVVLAGMGAAVLMPNFVRARGQGQFTACKSNLKNVGTALEMWSTDNRGRYPARLSQLTPDYLRAVPTCPSAGTATYAAGYVSAAHPDAYTVVCTGHNHAASGAGPNYPQYNFAQGLVER